MPIQSSNLKQIWIETIQFKLFLIQQLIIRKISGKQAPIKPEMVLLPKSYKLDFVDYFR